MCPATQEFPKNNQCDHLGGRPLSLDDPMLRSVNDFPNPFAQAFQATSSEFFGRVGE